MSLVRKAKRGLRRFYYESTSPNLDRRIRRIKERARPVYEKNAAEGKQIIKRSLLGAGKKVEKEWRGRKR